MARLIFDWTPDVGSTLSQAPKVHVAKFGDGYEARTTFGLNAQPMTWTMAFTRSRVEIVPILEFLQNHKATEAFDWTNPLNQVGIYVCREWKVSHNSGHAILSCGFEQVFEA